MNASAPRQHSAYTTNQRSEESLRETEAHALLSCASRLEAARLPECDWDTYLDAVRHNQRLWSVFQGCLCDAGNELPRNLKTILLNLSVYVDKTSFAAMSDKDPSALQSLIDINRNIAAGLSAKPKAESAAVPPMPEKPSTIITSA